MGNKVILFFVKGFIFSLLASSQLSVNIFKMNIPEPVRYSEYIYDSEICLFTDCSSSPTGYKSPLKLGFYWMDINSNKVLLYPSNTVITNIAREELLCNNSTTFQMGNLQTLFPSVASPIDLTAAQISLLNNNPVYITESNDSFSITINPSIQVSNIQRILFSNISDTNSIKYKYIYYMDSDKGAMEFNLQNEKIKEGGISVNKNESVDFILTLNKINGNNYIGNSLLRFRYSNINNKCKIRLDNLEVKATVGKHKVDKWYLDIYSSNDTKQPIDREILFGAKVKFAKKDVLPEEKILFRDMLQQEVLSIDDDTAKLKILPYDFIYCNKNDKTNPCKQNGIQLTDSIEGGIKRLYNTAAGRQVQKIIKQYNKRTLTTGVYLPKKDAAKKYVELILPNNISVAAYKNADKINIPIQIIEQSKRPYMFKYPEYYDHNLFRLPLENYPKGYDRIIYTIDKYPEDGSDIYIVGSLKDTICLKNETVELAPDNKINKSLGIFSVLSIVNSCGYTNHHEKIQIQTKAYRCDNPSSCGLYKYDDHLYISNEKDGLKWKYDKKIRPYSKTVPTPPVMVHDIIANLTEETIASEELFIPQIYAKENSSSKSDKLVYSLIKGLDEAVYITGLINLIGYSNEYPNSLAGYKGAEKIKLSIQLDKQKIAFETLMQKIDELNKISTFSAVYKNGKGPATASVAFMKANTGEIIAAADSRAFYLSSKNDNNDFIKTEKTRPDDSYLRWIPAYHNAQYFDTPGSAFKLVNALSLLSHLNKLEDLPDENDFDIQDKSDYKKLIEDMKNQEITDLFENDYKINSDKCFYPYIEEDHPRYSDRKQPDNDRKRQAYLKRINDYQSPETQTCTPMKDSINKLEGAIMISKSTWFAWMHEMITPALLMKSVNETPSGLLHTKIPINKNIMKQWIPVAKTLNDFKYDSPINLLTGVPIEDYQQAFNPPQSWILSPFLIKLNEVNSRERLRALSIGVGHVYSTVIHMASIAASISQGEVIYPKLTEGKSTYKNQALKELDLAPITNGMYKMANLPGGTGYKNFNSVIPKIIREKTCIYAKTGTAQLSNRDGNNAWLAGFYYEKDKASDECNIEKNKSKIISFSCSVKIVPINEGGASVCANLVGRIIKKMHKENLGNATS